MTHTDVIVVGAGPTGLMLAAELCLAGVRPLVLERQPQLRETPKANGFNGQLVDLVRYRGLLDRVEAASGRPVGPAPAAGFGGVHLDFSHLADPPIWAVHFPQPRLERLLGEPARELGAGIRRGHEVVGVSQDDATVTATCAARTDRGVRVRVAHLGVLLLQTTEDEPAEAGDDTPMTLIEFQDSTRRVLGADLPLADVTRLSRYTFQARQAGRPAGHLPQRTPLRRGPAPCRRPKPRWHCGAGRTRPHKRPRELFLEVLADEQPLRRMGALIPGAGIRYPMPGSSQHPLTCSAHL